MDRTFLRFSDHPRSRGVYGALASSPNFSRGSSPLARGLLAFDGVFIIDWRIIPARAGFTAFPGSRGRLSRDHPRSRGVYTDGLPSLPYFAGSSPLARGLLDVIGDPELYDRIIPARAGFTAGWCARCHALGDHPRSRGVYGPESCAVVAVCGSSPLARGLLNQLNTAKNQARIIPARAGFTPATPPASDRRPDHPRSRGVY